MIVLLLWYLSCGWRLLEELHHDAIIVPKIMALCSYCKPDFEQEINTLLFSTIFLFFGHFLGDIINTPLQGRHIWLQALFWTLINKNIRCCLLFFPNKPSFFQPTPAFSSQALHTHYFVLFSVQVIHAAFQISCKSRVLTQICAFLLSLFC